jgi:hypothetical protein
MQQLIKLIITRPLLTMNLILEDPDHALGIGDGDWRTVLRQLLNLRFIQAKPIQILPEVFRRAKPKRLLCGSMSSGLIFTAVSNSAIASSRHPGQAPFLEENRSKVKLLKVIGPLGIIRVCSFRTFCQREAVLFLVVSIQVRQTPDYFEQPRNRRFGRALPSRGSPDFYKFLLVASSLPQG